MSTAVLLLQQVIMMFLLAGVGMVLYHTKKISDMGARTIGNILIYVSLPCVIIKSFLTGYSHEKLIGLGISALLAAVVIVISMIISRLAFRKDAIATFSAAFANPGFFGVPLIVASISDGAVFYVAAFIAILNIMQWTWGVSLLTGEKGSLTPKAILTAPMMIAIIIGLICFFGQFPVPALITSAITYMAGLNTPLAMFAVGVYFARANVKEMFMRRSLYAVSAVRLLVIPLIAMAILSLVPETFADLKLAVLIASACPVGSNVAVYAQLHDKDYPYAVEAVVHSTVFSLITIPLMVRLAGMIW